MRRTNRKPMSTTFEVSHAEISLLKLDAPASLEASMVSSLDTALTAQRPRQRHTDIPFIFVMLEVSHAEMFPLKLFA